MKKAYVFVPIFLLAVFIITVITPIITMSEDISTKVFRLHILANSDENNDQELKLYVRDKVLAEAGEIFYDCKSLNDAISVTKDSISTIQSIVDNAIKEKGYNYTAKLKVTKEFFNTRYYNNFTLPAGTYDCLKIEIGKAMGHNWWCVMYPNVCLSGCTEEFDKELSDEELSFITNDKYIVKFKIVEIYEKIKLDIEDKIN